MDQTPILLALLITALPLCAFVIQVFFGRFLPRQGDWLPTSAVGAGLVMSLYLFFTQVLGAPHGMEHPAFWKMTWLSIGETSPFVVNFEVMIDNLSIVMLVVVTLVSFLVHLFSTGYMKGEERYNRFFAYLALFTFSMLGLIITSSMLMLFIFWELVGLCSYLLIGFYFTKDSAAAACKKAFLTNRVGDTGFFLGLMMIATVVGSFSFPDIFDSVRQGMWSPTLLTIAGICIFMGAVSKSAQFPLHVWLPDAMEGPTPVSALIHAATMVAAGVYMIVRMFPFLAGWDAEAGQSAMMTGNYFESDTLFLIAMVGGFTAIFAATIAVAQYDIKKVLAYSTVSQLGYMVMGVGVGSPAAGMYHLFTHAMFKACLFLGSGSIILAMHHEQDMRKMGGLRKKLPITHITFLLATLALSGVPFFSGMISKEAVLTQAYAYWEYHKHLSGGLALERFLPFLFCLVAAAFTAFYMFRLVIGIFYGKPRDQHAYDHAHESPRTMTIPLMVLAAIAVIGAGIAVPGGPGTDWFENRNAPEVVVGGMMSSEAMVPSTEVREAWESGAAWHDVHVEEVPETAPPAIKEFHHAYHLAHWPTFLLATLCGILGIALAYWIFFFNRGKEYVKPGGILDTWRVWLVNLYYVDDIFKAVPIAFTHWMARLCAAIDRVVVDSVVNGAGILGMVFAWVAGKIDYWAVDGAVRGTGELVLAGGERVRRIQTGRIQDYVGLTVFGMTIVFVVVMVWTNWN
ncbi:MAG TPA: NADH-quinone oxidoreductase subunit L [Planctomycetes bacterium]|nr:NADH-quinone oxidoreductase subunit L [Planctomycetota bacterium]